MIFVNRIIAVTLDYFCVDNRSQAVDRCSCSDCSMASVATDQPPSWLMSSPQFYRLQTNRSPVESPPTAKKFLRVMSCSHDPRQNVDDTTACKENRSILKRVDCSSRSKCWYSAAQPPPSRRRVNFHEDVAVVAYDGEHVCYESQRLNTEPRDRRQFISRTLLARLTKSFDEHSTCDVQQCAGVRQTSARPLPHVLAPVDNGCLPPPVIQTFTFHENGSGQLWLRLTVPLGRGVTAGDALVKANVAGNKLRVLGTRDSATPARRHQFATRYALPMHVDPYALSARMDSAGHLFVEAPVRTAERRYTTAADCTGVTSRI